MMKMRRPAVTRLPTAALQRALEYADSSRHDEADVTAFLEQVSARLAIDGVSPWPICAPTPAALAAAF